MGPVVSTRPLTRKLTGRPAALWVTGQLGDANLAALQKKTTPAFELRNQESEVIRKHATGCMDTSGGFMDALWTLHTLNSKIRIELHAEKIPIATGIYEFAHSIGIPPETALVGGAGEYELLFSTPDDLSDSAKTELEKMGMTRIADLSTNPNTGIFICQTGKPVRGMTTPPPCPRAIHSTTDYINAVASFAADLFGEDR
jgi:thiamine monophosphate kinase